MAPALLRSGAGATARGDHGQAARLEVICPASARGTGSSSRRTASRSSWWSATRGARAGAEWSFGSLVLGGERGRRAGVGRQRRHRLRRRGTGAPAEEAAAARAQDVAVPEAAEDAARPQGRGRVGRAEARRRGLVRRVHPRRPPARAGLPGPARRQGRERGAARDGATDPRGDRQGQAGVAALEPRQAVLAGGGDHQGRPARVLPRRRASADPAYPRPALHVEALPRRLAGQVLLPEGRAGRNPGLDPDDRARGLDPREAAAAPQDSGAARQRRARPAVDGEHGLHRSEHVVLAGGQARPARLRALRSRSVPERRLQRDRAGGTARQGGAGHAGARVVPEDERGRRDPRARADYTPAYVRGHARSSRRSSPARSPRPTAGW